MNGPSGAIVAVVDPRPRENDGKGDDVWCVRCFGMSEPRTPWIPAFAGMTEEGVPGCAVRTVTPAFAGMTGNSQGDTPQSFPRRRESMRP